MRRTLLGVAWLSLYLFIILAPILLMFLPPVPTGRSFWVELSVALGFVGLTQIGIQFVLIARFKPLTYPYGIDVVLKYHRQIAVVALLFVLLHPVLILLEHPARIVLFNPFGGTYASKFGLAAVVLLLALTVTSIWREKLKISYETWRLLHTGMGILALVAAQVHVSLAGLYVNTFWKQLIWVVSSVAMVSLIAYLRLVKPYLQKRQPWRVVGVRQEGGDTVNIDVEAVGHDGFRFHPGQFAWIKVGRTPYTMEEHPYSFTGSAEKTTRLSFGVKALGDFSARLQALEVGTTVYIDGPHGAFSIDRAQAPGYVFIAGGVGITPMMSFLRTLADRQDPRPIILIYSTNEEHELAYRDEIEGLKDRLDLETVYVLDEPPHDWAAEEGRVTGQLLDRRLPKERFTRRFFICGPSPMMAAVEQELLADGVPRTHIHLEEFALA
ncbi:ferric reductase-like transmembrane domain-containing protein [Neolewinella lacunae]|uniref:Ferric reductase-like transmembrane domain-containing protein n=1 Tax=Neolewinella lacunae TaxID=1517758 RepID=A0A923T7G3_9BACT|nr:ferric reductase-like transmembrane domain-containing protein [Neolewinella lacunae]MBC6992833.1 ferric reductase-like transmembrane domain-containing protein [Neolewinella lacunae]MDN3633860.1 ferric reductase-like transmembrane domain-containing protein [Neolewinella lacunae]